MAEYTVKDIAKMVGISTGTVSRVLNGAGNVDPQIVERTIKVLRETGYLENKRYRNRERKAARTNRICVIAPGMSPAWSNNSLWTNYFSGIELACRSRNYKCEIHFAESGVSPLDIAKSLQSCDGVLMKTPTVLPDFLPFLKKEIPLVCFGGFNPLLECPQFVLDNHACGMLATETLLQMGHRDVVFVNHESGHRMFVGRCLGYIETMRYSGLFRPDRIIEIPGNPELEYEPVTVLPDMSGVVQNILVMHPRPTAVIMANDWAAAAFFNACAAAGVRIPGDISVISFDNYISICEILNPPLSSVALPLAEAAEFAARTLFDLIEHIGVPRQNVAFTQYFSGKIYLRSSTANIKGEN